MTRNDTAKRRTIAAALATAAVAVPLTAGSGIPTFDASNLKELVDNVRTAAATVQQLRGLAGGLVRIKDSIGGGLDVDSVDRIAANTGGWIGNAERTDGWIRDKYDLGEEDEQRPATYQGGSQGSPGLLKVAAPSGRRGAAWPPAGGLIEVQAGPHTDEAPPPLTQRGGPIDEWKEGEAVDRPGFANAKQAMGFALAKLFHLQEEGTDPARADERKARHAIHTRRAQFERAAALNAWALASAAPQALAEREEQRNELIGLMDKASGLRDDVMALGAATIMTVAARTDLLLLHAAGVELEAMRVLKDQPATLTDATRRRLAGGEPVATPGSTPGGPV